MPTPKRPSARCAEGLSFYSGRIVRPDRGRPFDPGAHEHGEGMARDRERGWRASFAGMELRCRRDGNDRSGVWCRVERYISISWSSFVCGARLPDRSLPILDSLYGKQPRLMTGLFFRVRRSSAWGPWALIVWALDEHGEGMASVRCGDGERFLAGWNHAAAIWEWSFARMLPISAGLLSAGRPVLCARRTERLARGRSSAWMYDTGW